MSSWKIHFVESLAFVSMPHNLPFVCLLLMLQGNFHSASDPVWWAFVSDIVWQTPQFTYSNVCVNEKNTLKSLFHTPLMAKIHTHTAQVERNTWCERWRALACVWYIALQWHMSTLAISMKSFAKTFHAYSTHRMPLLPPQLGSARFGQAPMHRCWTGIMAICLFWKLTSLCISRNCCLIFRFSSSIRLRFQCGLNSKHFIGRT